MRRTGPESYACSRPKRLTSGEYRLVVEQLLEMPPPWELKAWYELLGHQSTVSVACSAKRAIEGQVGKGRVEMLNRQQVRVKYEVTGRIVSRVSKGAAKSTASNQG